MRILAQIMLIVVTFAWQPNTEPDMSHYRVYQRIGSTVKMLRDNIVHPTSTVSIDIPYADLAVAAFYATAVDTEGFESEPSNEAVYDRPILRIVKE